MQRAIAWSGLLSVGMVALAVGVTVTLHGQAHKNSYPQSPMTNSGAGNSSRSGSVDTTNGRNFDTGFSGFDPNFSHRQVVARREELHKRLVDNAARLLALTRELQEDLQTHEANEGDGKRLDDIARLARAVRDGMRQ